MATNVFELFAKLGLDSSDYESGLGRARSMFSSVGGALGAGVTALAGATTAAVGAAATGVVNLTSQAVNAYGEFEQLTGGISKLFGTSGMSLEEYADSVGATVDEIEDEYNSLARAEELMGQNASEAYATAGMSANEYMQSVTGFSAALINSLGGDTEQAAEIADMAMRDLADNANTFGVQSAQELANVYGALARGSFQTLDSLNLGFAGTQEGMIELINASGILNEQIDSLENISFAQMLEAIHAVQENMGIAGTTANEAMGTIEGSIGMLQGAWQNLLVGLGDSEADLSGLIGNVVDSAMAVVQNITPVAQNAMQGIADLLTQLAPILEEQLPTMIETVLPALITAVTSIISAVATALPSIARVLLPQVSSVVRQVLPVILSLIPSFISIGGEIIGAVIQGLVENASEIAQAGLDVFQTLIDGFAEATDGEGLQNLIDTTMHIIEMIGNFLVENAPTLITAAVELITQLAMMLTDPENLQMMIDMALQLAVAIGDGLVQSAPALGQAVVAVIGNLLIALWNELPNILSTIGDLLGQIALTVIGLIGGMMGDSYDEIIGKLSDIGDEVSQSLEDFISGFTSWITDVTDGVSGLWEDIVSFFGDGIMNVMAKLDEWWEEISSWFTDLVGNAVSWASDFVDGFVSGIRDGISSVGSAFSDLASEAASFIHFSTPDQGDLADADTYAPDFISLFTSGIYAGKDDVANAFSDVFTMPDIYASAEGNIINAGGSTEGNMLQPIQVFIGGELVDEFVVESNQRVNYIGGGRG